MPLRPFAPAALTAVAPAPVGKSQQLRTRVLRAVA